MISTHYDAVLISAKRAYKATVGVSIIIIWSD